MAESVNNTFYKGYNIPDSKILETQDQVVNGRIRYFKNNVRKLNDPKSFAIGCNVEMVLLNEEGKLTSIKFFGTVDKNGEVIGNDNEKGIIYTESGIYKVFFYGSGMDIVEDNNLFPYYEIFETVGGAGIHSNVMLKSVYDVNNNSVVDSSERVIVDIVVQEDMNKYTIITTDGYIADSNNDTHKNKILGMAMNDVSLGNSVKVLTLGDIDNPSWSWTTNTTLFLRNSEISDIAPTTGFVIKVGIIRNATKIFIDVENSIKL